MNVILFFSSGFIFWVSSQRTLFKDSRWIECIDHAKGAGLNSIESLYCSDYLSPHWFWWLVLILSGIALLYSGFRLITE